jgi:integrase
LLPKHVKKVRSKGRDYYYFDTGKLVEGKKVYTRLPGIREAGFGGSYAALLGHRNRKAPTDLLRVPKLVDLYQRSPAYAGLATASQKLYDIYFRRLEKLLPTAPVGEITRGDMRKLIDGMSATPGAANAFLGAASALFGWARDREYIAANPCEGIDQLPGGEHHPWPEHVLRAALASDDSAVRLLTHLLYYTAQRLGDVLRMGWGDIADDRALVRQQKTGKVLSIPLHRALRAELAKRPQAGATIVVSTAGRPLSGDMARKALKTFTAEQNAPCVPHGLRKNAVIALLEAGCSVAETAAISGQTLRMVEHYARARDQAKLAGDAIMRWEVQEARADITGTAEEIKK